MKKGKLDLLEEIRQIKLLLMTWLIQDNTLKEKVKIMSLCNYSKEQISVILCKPLKLIEVIYKKQLKEVEK